MHPQLNFITVSTSDLDAVRRFYVAGLGWQPMLDVPDEVVFFQVGPGLMLGFFEATRFAADMRSDVVLQPSGYTLSHNVTSREEVNRVVEAAVAAGAQVLKQPQESAFGGIYNAHFVDPVGVVWEIAHNPGWRVEPDGTVVLG